MVEQAEDVPDVAGVLEDGPRVLVRAFRRVRTPQRHPPAREHTLHDPRRRRGRRRGGIETALRAGPLQDPGPIFGIRDDRHASSLSAFPPGRAAEGGPLDGDAAGANRTLPQSIMARFRAVDFGWRPRISSKTVKTIRDADQRMTVAAARLRRSPEHGCVSCCQPTSASRGREDVAEFLHVDVDHRTVLVVLVAADDLSGSLVNMMQAVSRHRTRTTCTSMRHGQFAPMSTGPVDASAQVHDLAYKLLRSPVRPK